MAAKALPCPTVLRLFLRYDPETGALTWKPRARAWFKTENAWATWSARFPGSPALGVVSARKYMTGTILGQSAMKHRVVWAIVHGEWPEVVDHIDGDPTNNRLANLRSGTSEQNNRNHRRNVRNTSGHTGVRFCRQNNRWVMQIRCGGRKRISQTFTSKEAAINAHAEWKKRLGYTDRHGT